MKSKSKKFKPNDGEFIIQSTSIKGAPNESDDKELYIYTPDKGDWNKLELDPIELIMFVGNNFDDDNNEIYQIYNNEIRQFDDEMSDTDGDLYEAQYLETQQLTNQKQDEMSDTEDEAPHLEKDSLEECNLQTVSSTQKIKTIFKLSNSPDIQSSYYIYTLEKKAPNDKFQIKCQPVKDYNTMLWNERNEKPLFRKVLSPNPNSNTYGFNKIIPEFTIKIAEDTKEIKEITYADDTNSQQNITFFHPTNQNNTQLQKTQESKHSELITTNLNPPNKKEKKTIPQEKKTRKKEMLIPDPQGGEELAISYSTLKYYRHYILKNRPTANMTPIPDPKNPSKQILIPFRTLYKKTKK